MYLQNRHLHTAVISSERSGAPVHDFQHGELTMLLNSNHKTEPSILMQWLDSRQWYSELVCRSNTQSLYRFVKNIEYNVKDQQEALQQLQKRSNLAKKKANNYQCWLIFNDNSPSFWK